MGQNWKTCIHIGRRNVTLVLILKKIKNKLDKFNFLNIILIDKLLFIIGD